VNQTEGLSTPESRKRRGRPGRKTLARVGRWLKQQEVRNERSPSVADGLGSKQSRTPWQEDGGMETKAGSRSRGKAGRKGAKPPEPVVSLGFYRKHTESLLRRYLYASMQVGRAPSILGDPIARGWCSSRPVRTFEDAVIFVLDVEKCLNQLGVRWTA
jgi:hypothetical protein